MIRTKPSFIFFTIVITAILYSLGIGITRYIGSPINWQRAILGQVWIVSFQIGTIFLKRWINFQQVGQKQRNENGSIIGIAFIALTIAASVSIFLIKNSGYVLLPISMIIAVIGAILYVAPIPILREGGYGELIEAIFVSSLVPFFSFILQTERFHRFVILSTFPFILIYLALCISVELPQYRLDGFETQTLISKMGWDYGIKTHNLLLLTAFTLFGVGIQFGLPFIITLPVFLTLPLVGYQIWQMISISNGKKPNWQMLTFFALVLYGLPAYLLTFGYWIK